MPEHTQGPPALARELRALKRRGCNLLVVNDASTVAPSCRRLLGTPALDRRYVFLPTTASVADVLSRCSATDPEPDPARVGVVDASTATRTRSAARPPDLAARPDPTEVWYSRVENLADLPRLLELAADHLRRVAPRDPGPGDVRFCLESLDPLVDELDRRQLFRLVHALTGSVRSVRGMGHFHVTRATYASDLDALAPLFDAAVSVEAGDDGPRHRWRLHESGYETDWLPLDA
jgi:hypothetical protein